jgi:hypothetical protein
MSCNQRAISDSLCPFQVSQILVSKSITSVAIDLSPSERDPQAIIASSHQAPSGMAMKRLWILVSGRRGSWPPSSFEIENSEWRDAVKKILKKIRITKGI